ncbi:uncharacterized protein LOC134739138 [Pongo pygmaeus]|uniref:uncharacterized protein LOC134739138 n=1 Tax=Pongo pygmaeus TaxID=9600 RepID=UPI00300CE154
MGAGPHVDLLQGSLPVRQSALAVPATLPTPFHSANIIEPYGEMEQKAWPRPHGGAARRGRSLGPKRHGRDSVRVRPRGGAVSSQASAGCRTALEGCGFRGEKGEWLALPPLPLGPEIPTAHGIGPSPPSRAPPPFPSSGSPGQFGLRVSPTLAPGCPCCAPVTGFGKPSGPLSAHLAHGTFLAAWSVSLLVMDGETSHSWRGISRKNFAWKINVIITGLAGKNRREIKIIPPSYLSRTISLTLEHRPANWAISLGTTSARIFEGQEPGVCGLGRARPWSPPHLADLMLVP